MKSYADHYNDVTKVAEQIAPALKHLSEDQTRQILLGYAEVKKENFVSREFQNDEPKFSKILLRQFIADFIKNNEVPDHVLNIVFGEAQSQLNKLAYDQAEKVKKNV